MQVLLVEDDEGVASALAELLGHAGASVIRTSRGADALHRVKGCDLVLLDLGLPDMDGLDVLRTLRRASAVPVIIMTARDSDGAVVLGLRAGADDYLVKPVRKAVLLARIDAVMRRLRRVTGDTTAPAGPVVAGPVTIDRERREVALDGNPQALTRDRVPDPGHPGRPPRRSGQPRGTDARGLGHRGGRPVQIVGLLHRTDQGQARRAAAADGARLRFSAGPSDMGLRVRIVLVVLSLLAVAALAVPLALSLADRRTATLAAERDRQLAALADAAAMPDTPLQRLVDRYHEVYGEGLLIIDADGRTLASRGLDVSEPGVATAAEPRPRRRAGVAVGPIMPWDRRSLVATAGVRQDGELVGAVVLAVDTTASRHGISRDPGCGWRSAVLVVLMVAAVVARALTRWVLRPLNGLERAVAEMTEGVAGPPADVAGPPELRHFTSAFNTMAQVVRASLDRQRRLVADASHQLRNPLAAVRLRADSLADSVTEAGQLDVRLDDGGARPTGESAAAADAAGARRTGQRKPPGRSVGPQTSRRISAT